MYTQRVVHEGKVGIVGAGRLGATIAALSALAHREVVLVDTTAEKARAGVEDIGQLVRDTVRRERRAEDAMLDVIPRIVPSGAVEDLRGTSIVIEADVEELDRKRSLLTRLDGIIEPETILATATARFCVRQLAGGTRHPERVLGLHFLYPHDRNRLVEVVAEAIAEPARIARLWRFAQSLGRIPIRSADRPGFVVNRMIMPLWVEAICLMEERVAEPNTIDTCLMDLLGAPLGPFAQMNMVGLATSVDLSDALAWELGEDWRLPQAAKQYRDANLDWPLGGTPSMGGAEAVRERLTGRLLFVAGKLLDEHITNPEGLVRSCAVGLGWRHSPLELPQIAGIEWAERVLKQSCEKAGEDLPDWWRRGARRLGRRFTPRRVGVRCAENVAVIVVDHPETDNELRPALCNEITEVVDGLDADIVRIVLASSAGVFLSGPRRASIRQQVKDNSLNALIQPLADLLRALREHPAEIVAALSGLAQDAGAELLLHCDRVVVERGARFKLSYLHRGLPPLAQGVAPLVERCGLPLARHLLLTGRQVGAKGPLALQRMGIAHQVANPGRSLARARKAAPPEPPLQQGQAPSESSTVELWTRLWTDSWTPVLLSGDLPTDLPDSLAPEAGREQRAALEAPAAALRAGVHLLQGGDLHGAIDLCMSDPECRSLLGLRSEEPPT